MIKMYELISIGYKFITSFLDDSWLNGIVDLTPHKPQATGTSWGSC